MGVRRVGSSSVVTIGSGDGDPGGVVGGRKPPIFLGTLLEPMLSEFGLKLLLVLAFGLRGGGCAGVDCCCGDSGDSALGNGMSPLVMVCCVERV